MSDDEPPVAAFLDDAETVFEEYDQGYMDADAALARLRDGVERLRRARRE
jgi:hypothetical protein